jgi:hypothetical protein
LLSDDQRDRARILAAGAGDEVGFLGFDLLEGGDWHAGTG